jgi:hypothetical protein
MNSKTLEKIFNYVNRELFGDTLDMPLLFFINPNQTVYAFVIDGYCERHNGLYTIGITRGLTDTNTFDTMVHEMIHQHLMETKDYEGHGKPFIKMCRKAIEEFYWETL